MPIDKCSIRDMEYNKFVECPEGSGQPAVKVVICDDGPLPALFEEHYNGKLVNSGDTLLITPTSGKIRSIIIQNPTCGPNRNGVNKCLLVSVDGGVNYFSIPNGGTWVSEGVSRTDMMIKAHNNNVKYEIVLERD